MRQKSQSAPSTAFALRSLLCFALLLSASASADRPRRVVVSRALFESRLPQFLRRIRVFETARALADAGGFRLWAIGGTAAAASFAALDAAARPPQTDPVEIAEILSPLADCDLAIDGTATDAANLQETLRRLEPFHRADGRSIWDIRPLYEAMGEREPLLGPQSDYPRQNNDTLSIGAVELTAPHAGEARVRNLLEWDHEDRYFTPSIVERNVRLLVSPQHYETRAYRDGRNPDFFAAFRFLGKAMQFALPIDADDWVKLRRIVGLFRREHIASAYVRNWFETSGRRVVMQSTELARAFHLFDMLELRTKLRDALGKGENADSFARLIAREPLQGFPVGTGTGRTAEQLNITKVTHTSGDLAAYASLHASTDGHPNAFQSRPNTPGESADLGVAGLYCLRGERGGKETGYDVVIDILPHAREHKDFELVGEMFVLINRNAGTLATKFGDQSLERYFSNVAGARKSGKLGAHELFRNRAIDRYLQMDFFHRALFHGWLDQELRHLEPAQAAAMASEWLRFPAPFSDASTASTLRDVLQRTGRSPELLRRFLVALRNGEITSPATTIREQARLFDWYESLPAGPDLPSSCLLLPLAHRHHDRFERTVSDIERLLRERRSALFTPGTFDDWKGLAENEPQVVLRLAPALLAASPKRERHLIAVFAHALVQVPKVEQEAAIDRLLALQPGDDLALLAALIAEAGRGSFGHREAARRATYYTVARPAHGGFSDPADVAALAEQFDRLGDGEENRDFLRKIFATSGSGIVPGMLETLYAYAGTDRGVSLLEHLLHRGGRQGIVRVLVARLPQWERHPAWSRIVRQLFERNAFVDGDGLGEIVASFDEVTFNMVPVLEQWLRRDNDNHDAKTLFVKRVLPNEYFVTSFEPTQLISLVDAVAECRVPGLQAELLKAVLRGPWGRTDLWEKIFFRAIAANGPYRSLSDLRLWRTYGIDKHPELGRLLLPLYKQGLIAESLVRRFLARPLGSHSRHMLPVLLEWLRREKPPADVYGKITAGWESRLHNEVGKYPTTGDEALSLFDSRRCAARLADEAAQPLRPVPQSLPALTPLPDALPSPVPKIPL